MKLSLVLTSVGVTATLLLFGAAKGVGALLPPSPEVIFSANVADERYDIYLANTAGIVVSLAQRQYRPRDVRESPAGDAILFANEREAPASLLRVSSLRVQPILTDARSISTPVWSPDGERIAYANEGDYPGQLFITDANGENAIALNNQTALNRPPVWSPDGTRLLFQSRLYGYVEMFVVDVDTGSITQIGHQRSGRPVTRMAWSPDGERIAYEVSDGSRAELYLADAHTGAAERVTHPSNFVTLPDWSPDGERIAFVAMTENDSEIYVYDLTTQTTQRITNSPNLDTDPVWSPDGERIAFRSMRDGYEELYVMDADGANVRQLSHHRSYFYFPNQSHQWSADGRYLLYWHPMDSGEVFVVQVDGGRPLNLSQNAGWDGLASWRPSPR